MVARHTDGGVEAGKVEQHPAILPVIEREAERFRIYRDAHVIEAGSANLVEIACHQRLAPAVGEPIGQVDAVLEGGRRHLGGPGARERGEEKQRSAERCKACTDHCMVPFLLLFFNHHYRKSHPEPLRMSKSRAQSKIGVAFFRMTRELEIDRPRLLIGSKNYSSWSLRGWLMAKMAGLDFIEQSVALDNPAHRAEVLLLSPSILVPTLFHNGIRLWDPLAIGEYL